MAVVYRARDLRHDRDVALEVLRLDVGNAMGRERFLREIRLAALYTSCRSTIRETPTDGCSPRYRSS